jgi:predicted dehydrogenase
MEQAVQRVMGIVFGIIGSGWRSEFYLRIAKALPERFTVCGLVTRSPEKGAEIEKNWGVKTFRSLAELLEGTARRTSGGTGGCSPDFVVISVSKDAAYDLILEAASKGVPVLAETPPAYDLDRLISLNRLAKGARIQVAEQYHLHPMHSSRIRIARSGILGELSEAQVSFSQGYHSISLMRKLLGVGFENATIRAFQYTSPVVAGPSRSGPPEQEKIVPSAHEFALLDFGGKLGVHDFIKDQHRSWVRSQRIVVRGDRGELFNNTVKYLKDFRTPVEYELIRKNAGEEGNMEGYCLKGILAGGEWTYVNQFRPAGFSDDELAVAECLVRMDRYAKGGPGFYSLAEASQDTYLSLMIDKAIACGEKVATETQPWGSYD